MAKKKEKAKKYLAENEMVVLCRYIQKTHAGYNDDGTPYDGERSSSLPGYHHFQDVKSPEEFRKHIGNPTGIR